MAFIDEKWLAVIHCLKWWIARTAALTPLCESVGRGSRAGRAAETHVR
jgi:hypothetical protein